MAPLERITMDGIDYIPEAKHGEYVGLGEIRGGALLNAKVLYVSIPGKKMSFTGGDAFDMTRGAFLDSAERELEALGMRMVNATYRPKGGTILTPHKLTGEVYRDPVEAEPTEETAIPETARTATPAAA